MGFIKWHGEKEDHYEDVVAYAEENAKLEAEEYRIQMRKKEEVELFGVPELLSMGTEMILKLLVKEKKGLDIIYSSLIKDSHITIKTGISEDIVVQFYTDSYFYLFGAIFYHSKVGVEKQKKLVNVFWNRVFIIKSQILLEEAWERQRTCQGYREYLEHSFEIRSGYYSRFWQWIGLLSRETSQSDMINKFVMLYIRFQMHLAYYTAQLAPDMEIGRSLAKQHSMSENVIRCSIMDGEKLDFTEIQIENPIFQIHREEDAKKRARLAEEERKKQFICYVKYAKILPGYSSMEKEDRVDMITAGKLYEQLREKKLELRHMVSIFPNESKELLEQGMLPVLYAEEAGLTLRENEILHYVECAIVYRELPGEEVFYTQKGRLYITNQRICILIGNHYHEIPFDQLNKAVLYEVLPEIIEFASEEDIWFVQTADTGDTYKLLRMILSRVEEKKEDSVNMEFLHLDKIEDQDMETYIFSLEACCEAELPLEMEKLLRNEIKNLQALNEALKKYPEHVQQAHRFVTYYIPESMRLMFSFLEYEKAGISSQRLNPVYDSVMESIQKVSQAALQRVDEIYKMATMDTLAKADALQKIMGQDGYTSTGEHRGIETVLKL